MRIQTKLVRLSIKLFMLIALSSTNIALASQYYDEDEPRPGAVDPVSDDAVRVLMIRESVASFGRSCPCPYSVNGFGGQCGTNSYYYKPGASRRIYCYLADIPSRLVVFFRQKNGYHSPLMPESASMPFFSSESTTTVSSTVTTKNEGVKTATSSATTTSVNTNNQNATQSTTQTTTQAGAKPDEPTKSFISNYQKNTPPDWNKVLTQ